MRYLAAIGITLVLGLMVACGNGDEEPALPGGSSPTATASGGPAASGGGTQATATPVAGTATETPGTTPAADVLDPVALEIVADNTDIESAEARFAPEGSDQVAVTAEVVLVDGGSLMFDAFGLLVMPGTCAEQADPVDFGSAAGRVLVDIGWESAPIVLELADLRATPHSVVITNAPGNVNLACGDIAT